MTEDIAMGVTILVGPKMFPLSGAGASTNSLSRGAGRCSSLLPSHSFCLRGCRPWRIADGSIGGQCPLMDSRPKPPSIFAEPLSVSEAWERAGGDQGPSCICGTKARVVGQGCTPARGCNHPRPQRVNAHGPVIKENKQHRQKSSGISWI